MFRTPLCATKSVSNHRTRNVKLKKVNLPSQDHCTIFDTVRTPFNCSENEQVEYSICTYTTVKKSVLMVLGFKSRLLTKNQNQNLHFWIIFLNSFRNEPHTFFLPYFYTQHFTCEKMKSQGFPEPIFLYSPKPIFFIHIQTLFQ